MHLNVIQLAESLGVEEDVVEGWVRNESLPAIEDRGRLLFDRAQVIAWATERGLAAKAGFLAAERAGTPQARGLAALLRTGGILRDLPAAELLNQLERIVAALPGATPGIRALLAQLTTSGTLTVPLRLSPVSDHCPACPFSQHPIPIAPNIIPIIH